MLVTVENGRAVRVAGDPDHPVTQGFLCAKVNRYVERTYHDDRLRTPMRRVGPKGSGKFEPITWDEALDEIATRLGDIARSSDGPQAILPYSYAGTMGLVQGSSMDRRFFHLLGASKLDRTICSMAGTIGMRMTVGANVGADGEGRSRRAISFCCGARTRSRPTRISGRSCSRRASAARRSSASIPSARAPPMQCDEWLPDSARHRRRARARHDARAVRARTRGSRVSRAVHARSRGAARARRGVDARTHGHRHRAAGRDDRLARPSGSGARKRRSFA